MFINKNTGALMEEKFQLDVMDVMLKYSESLGTEEQSQILIELGMSLFFKDYFKMLRIFRNQEKKEEALDALAKSTTHNVVSLFNLQL